MSEHERALADRLRALRVELSDLGDVRACTSCSHGMPLPMGRWDGGHCCGGDTADVFSDGEVFALALSGTRARHLRPPQGDHAGCAFRGASGCSLRPVDRPNVCVRYLCGDLRAELHARGALMSVVESLDEMEDLYGQLSALHKAHMERAELRALHPLLGTDPGDAP